MNKFTVLLVDDEEELVSTLKERLHYRGIEAEFLTNGFETINRLRAGHFDVLVLDLKMPGMSGLEVVAAVKKEFSNLPIILLTGHGATDQEKVDIPDGVFDYIMKPINIGDLIQKMQAAVESSHA